MIIIKWIILLLTFLISSLIGIMLANKYKDRVKDLKDARSALNMLKTKIEYTYEPLPEIFTEIGKAFNSSVRRNFSYIK